MRVKLVETLIELAEEDTTVILLTADLGFNVLEPFATRFPGRLINVGVCEENMVGLATGLALAGFTPYIYSIAPFAILKTLEFIRNGPTAHGLPIHILGIGDSFEYGTAGPTHHNVEDVAVLRPLNLIKILIPADQDQLVTMLKCNKNLPGPFYYRVSKDFTDTVPYLNGEFNYTYAQKIKGGSQLLFITSGIISAQVYEAAVELESHGISATVAIVSNFSPAPVKYLEDLLDTCDTVITVETHVPEGGLGSLIAEIITESETLQNKLVRFAVQQPYTFTTTTGSRSWYLQSMGLTKDHLVQHVLKWQGVQNED